MGSYSIRLNQTPYTTQLFSALNFAHARQIELRLVVDNRHTEIDWVETDERHNAVRNGETRWDRGSGDQRLLGDGVIDHAAVQRSGNRTDIPTHVPTHQLLGLLRSSIGKPDRSLIIQSGQKPTALSALVDRFDSELRGKEQATAADLEALLNQNLPSRPFRVVGATITINPPADLHPSSPWLLICYQPLDIASFVHAGDRYAVAVAEQTINAPPPLGSSNAATAAFEENFGELPGFRFARANDRQIMAYFDLSQITLPNSPNFRLSRSIDDFGKSYYKGIPALLAEPTRKGIGSTGLTTGGFGQDPSIFGEPSPGLSIDRSPVPTAWESLLVSFDPGDHRSLLRLRDSILDFASGEGSPLKVITGNDPVDWRLEAKDGKSYAFCHHEQLPGEDGDQFAFEVNVTQGGTNEHHFVSYQVTKTNWTSTYSAFKNGRQLGLKNDDTENQFLLLQRLIFNWIHAETKTPIVPNPQALIRWPNYPTREAVRAALDRLTQNLVLQATTHRLWQRPFISPPNYLFTLGKEKQLEIKRSNQPERTTYIARVGDKQVTLQVELSSPITVIFSDPHNLWEVRGKMGDPTLPAVAFQDFQILALKLLAGSL